MITLFHCLITLVIGYISQAMMTLLFFKIKQIMISYSKIKLKKKSNKLDDTKSDDKCQVITLVDIRRVNMS